MNRLLTIVDSKYQRLEYLQATGTQWINTGVGKDSTHTYRFKGVVNFQDVTNRQLFGAEGFTYFGVVNGYYQVAQSSNSHISYQPSLNENIDFDVVFDLPNNKAYYNFNGTSGTQNPSGTYGLAGTFYLFNISNLSFPCKCKLYNFQLFDNDVLVRNFVPVLRKTDNELGMLDLVEGKFYPNAGTGKFTANLDTMYAIIQGSLTQSPYGVFSGFSASNYLQIQEMLDLTSNFEIEICITPSTVSLPSGAISTFIGGSFAFGISANYSGKLTAYIRNSNNDYIINGSQGQRAFVADTQYLVKLKQTKTNNTYNILISSSNDNGTSWLTEYNVNSNYPIKHDTLLNLCSAGNSSYPQQYFRGSIDLNNSYIKINSTKYRLQAVVGYTIVGSPTITDGVASGFSANDYLQIPDFPTYTQDDKVEFCTNIVLSSTYTASVFFGGTGALCVPYVNSVRKIVYYGSTIGLSGVSGTNTLTVGQNYYFKMIYDTTSFKAYISTDGINWVLDYSKSISPTFTKTGAVLLGRNLAENTQYLRGTMDLNLTYIKINNKLWFNGQQA